MKRIHLPLAGLVAIAQLAACSGEPPGMGSAVPPNSTAMTLVSSDLTLPVAFEGFQCQRVTVTRDMYIVKVMPSMKPGIHHLELAIDPDGNPDGVSPCTAALGSWTPLFAAGIGSPGLVLPDKVAFKVSAGQQVVLQLHLLNATGLPISNSATLEVAIAEDPSGYALADASFLGIKPFTVPANRQLQGQCTLSTNTKYFALFPHMHMTGAHMKVWTEGSVSQTVWDEDFDFNNQTVGSWNPMELTEGDRIKYICTYSPAGVGKQFGNSSTDEMCIAISYFTPPIESACRSVSMSSENDGPRG